MKRRSLTLVMFVLVQVAIAGCIRADRVSGSIGDRAVSGQGLTISGSSAGAPVATSFTPGGAIKSEDNRSSGRRRAGTPPKPELQFEGTITKASSASITVHDSHGADVIVLLTSKTDIRKGDLTIAATDLKVGDQVHVKAVAQNNSNTAIEVVVQGADDHEGREIEGTITKASAPSITVHDSHGADVIVLLTSKTVIRKGGLTIAAIDLKVGDQVHVKAVAQNNSNTALEVVVQGADDHEGMEIEGTITKASATSITVHDSHGADVILMLTSNTIIRKGDLTIAAADLKVGDRVHVKAVAQNLVNTATEIIVQKPDHEGEENGGDTATANGTVTGIVGLDLTVHTEAHGDITVKTDPSTIIRKQDATIAVKDIHVGDGVNCLGTLVADHTILARQIEVRGDGSGHH